MVRGTTPMTTENQKPEHIFCGDGDAPTDLCDRSDCGLPLSQHERVFPNANAEQAPEPVKPCPLPEPCELHPRTLQPPTPEPVEEGIDRKVLTCDKCGCTPGTRPRDCASCMDFVIEEGIALQQENATLRAERDVLKTEVEEARKIVSVDKPRKARMTQESLRGFEEAVDRAADSLMVTTEEAEAAKKAYRADFEKQRRADKGA